MPEPTTWLQKAWKSWRNVLGLIVVLFILGDIKGCIFPDHPAPVSLEADGKQYVACNTPDISRGFFHLASTYSVDFKDNNGSTISLRGVEKLIVTNLPQQVDAPMPSPGADDMSDTDSDGKPIAEGKIYNWDDGTEARWQKGKWVAVKIRNRVCESDEDREKRLANEEERREAHQKKIAAAAAAKLAQTCKDWEQKHPVGGPPDFFPHDGSALDGAIMGSPEGCEGPLETAYNDRVKQEEASRQAAQQLAQQKANLTESARTSAIPTHQGWASVKNQYAPTIYKRCHFSVDSLAACGYTSNGEIAQLKQGDRVELLSGKIRSASGTEIVEVRFQSWVGWMDTADLSSDRE